MSTLMGRYIHKLQTGLDVNVHRPVLFVVYVYTYPLKWTLTSSPVCSLCIYLPIKVDIDVNG
jgi:hypothetical protein